MSASGVSPGLHRWIDRLEGQNTWRFILTLYLLRWLVIIPAVFINGWVFPDQADSSLQGMGGLGIFPLFLAMLVINPLLETIIECSIPYWIFKRLGLLNHRPLYFILGSAILMAILHQTLASILPSLITGSFLAYTYAHFSLSNSLKAILCTMLFHASINLVGFALIVLGVLR